MMDNKGKYAPGEGNMALQNGISKAMSSLDFCQNGDDKGFTLVELIMIMTIISILAAIALPKFIDLKEATIQRTVGSVAASLNAGSSSNYQLSRTGTRTAIPVENCTDVESTIESAQALPQHYTITSLAISATDVSRRCTLTYTDPDTGATTTSHFIGYYVPPPPPLE